MIKNFKIKNDIRGMTYIELIMVLAIFSIIAGISVFSYRDFQQKIDLKNLASDIGIKIVEAQKSALSGKLAPATQQPGDPTTWKPSYGVYFHLDAGPNTGPNIFYSFVDLDQNQVFDYGAYGCPVSECLENVQIGKGNFISSIKAYDDANNYDDITTDLSISFVRPSSFATITSSQITRIVDHLEINISSLGSATARILVFPSGRLEIK